MSAESRAKKSAAITRRLIAMGVYRQARTIMVYMTHRSEVDTAEIVRHALRQGKMVTAPAVSGCRPGEMVARRLSCPETELLAGCHAIPEPDAKRCAVVAPAEIDVVLVPGLVFDMQGRRLGYGSGYYDRWLSEIDSSRVIGLAFECQLTRALPAEHHDVPVGVIVTENRILRTRTQAAE